MGQKVLFQQPGARLMSGYIDLAHCRVHHATLPSESAHPLQHTGQGCTDVHDSRQLEKIRLQACSF
jgi:hypothetical protein